MTMNRAQRLQEYLEGTLGWETRHEYFQCKCGHVEFEYVKFCSTCGKKMPKKPVMDTDVIDDLEKAIAYALDE